ncbi:hypothetical protein [Bifidobacterium sp. ESL0704]|uniref:hypothetical protein n=1 Tax=Bifidobacterium sp. ESL0704 TaxID=2983219 RepID=UPI0023F94969|nr:hypothetical protein [Bifidobacterium sp. ESL0704]WEV52782.1 hypothetical protein OZX64_07965 [Bifidobacterium sp. ESL0704]
MKRQPFIIIASLSSIVFMSLSLPASAIAAVSIPDDVTEFFNTQAPKEISEFEHEAHSTISNQTIQKDTAPALENIQQEYIVQPDANGKLEIKPTGDWMAAVLHDNTLTGIAYAHRNANDQLESGWSEDTTVAGYLLAANPGTDVVLVPWTNAYFSRTNGTLTALNDEAKQSAPNPINENEFLSKVQSSFDTDKKNNEQSLNQGKVPVSGSSNHAREPNTSTSKRISAIAIATALLITVVAILMLVHRKSNITNKKQD